MASTVRQAILVSIVFWIVVAVIAALAAVVGSNSFGDYLTFVALILLGVMLLISAPVGDRIAAFESMAWGGGTYRGEERVEAGGMTALGLLLILAPQVAIVSVLVA